MAIVREHYGTRKDGVNLFKTYSDEGMLILQNETGIEYSEAIDVENAPYTYSETDKPIDVDVDPDVDPEVDPEEATVADYIAALEELGVEV